MIPAPLTGVKADIVERFTNSEKVRVLVTTTIYKRFDEILGAQDLAPGG